MKIAVVCGVGGLPGLDAHVGAWKAVEAYLDRVSELNESVAVEYFGASAGAAIAAVQAYGEWGAGEFACWLRTLRREDVIRRPWGSYLCARHRQSIYDARPIQARLTEMLPVDFIQLRRPLTVAVTEMQSRGHVARRFSTGPRLREVVAASMSIAGIWPYVEIDGHDFSDGGTTDAIPLPERLTDYDQIIVLEPTRAARHYRRRDANAISRLLWNIEALGQKESSSESRRLTEGPLRDLVTWIDLPLGSASMLDFDHDLIGRMEIRVAHALRSAKLRPRLPEPATFFPADAEIGPRVTEPKSPNQKAQ